MGRYTKEAADRETVENDYPFGVDRDNPQKMTNYRRALRRLYLCEICNDVDEVIGHQATPEMYAASMVALALWEVDLASD